jgi:hypothetical protein
VVESREEEREKLDQWRGRREKSGRQREVQREVQAL